MDELEIDGKKYVSSRRAAKEHKYHTDYIGQLIRAGKIAGKKVGRAWYVEEVSLNTYLASESGAQPAPFVATPVIVQPPVAQVVPELVEEPVEIVEEVFEQEKIIPHIPHRPEQKVHITLAERELPQKRNTLTYITDEEPLLPVLEGRARANADFIPVPLRRHVAAEAQIEEREVEVEEEPQMWQTEISSPFRVRMVRTLVLAAVALLTFAFAGGTSALLATSIEVKDGQPASVALTIK